MTKQERCPKCGSKEKNVRLCACGCGEKSGVEPLIHQCTDPWHTQGQPEQSVSEKLWEFMEQFIGPTGGWLVSPKKLHAALVTYMQGKE